MDKSTRILNILTLLLKGRVVTQYDLNQFTDVSKKSIQRDIHTLNTFFYENDFWSGNNTRVIYNHQLSGYELKQDTKSKHSLGILSLLIKLQSLTPILHYDIHKFILNSISSMNITDKHVLMSTLNQFKVRQELLPGKTLMILQRAIVNKDIVRVEFQDRKVFIKPLSILYMHYDYWFTYEEDHDIHTVALRDIVAVKVLDLKFKRDGTRNPVLFELHTQIWNQFQQQFSIKEVVEENEDKVLVWVNCTRFDAYYIAYQLAPHAKILEPQSYIDSFIDRLDEIKEIYK
ncbi:HTH domain-containing protein [Staphylococcus taiwanensis]|nr:HTH domain-containing protein [Staphylococcus taiwanensis]